MNEMKSVRKMREAGGSEARGGMGRKCRGRRPE